VLVASRTVSRAPDTEQRIPESDPVSARLLQARFTPGSMVAERYRIVSLLGRGGMGEVYGADDLTLGQRVALKFLPADHAKSTAWRDLFYSEVRMARQISHPNVCRVYDIGESGDMLFLSMEFVDGEDLASLLRRIGRLPDDKAVEVAQQLCAGLAAAHRSGVLHRDLKPSNVMIDGKGRARITDFGLAVALSEANQEDRVVGTPGYFAPELLLGQAPSVQSDIYALGLVLYELFTGKKAFDGANKAELVRRQAETDPTPPSSGMKNLDPAVERAILRCLVRDPSGRPRSVLGVAAALPGGDPLSAALAAGETPSPEMVAAAGPQGSLRPAVAWAALAASLILILCTSMFLAPHTTDWGLAPMNKSPEVLADYAQDLAGRLGYPAVVDRAFWVGSEPDYMEYAAHHPSATDWRRTSSRHAWPSPVNFWYRQSPQWMTPTTTERRAPPTVTESDPPYETSGMVALKLDTNGYLLFLRAVPPQREMGASMAKPDWDLLLAEAGLDKAQLAPAPPIWAPPEIFDSRADWEGHFPGRPDLPIHISAAAYRGIPVYFQVIAPWDKPWRSVAAGESSIGSRISLVVELCLLTVYVVVGGFFARWNLRRGRGDARGALRLASFVLLLDCIYGVLNYHFAPDPNYVLTQFMIMGVPLFFALLVWIGYVAVEPYARRIWPNLMVSWQRLLDGRFRDPLVGRDIIFGALAGSVLSFVLLGANAWIGISETFPVYHSFGKGVWATIGGSVWVPSQACWVALSNLAVLTIATGILRRRWLGLIATGLLLLVSFSPNGLLDLALTLVYAAAFLAVLTRLGLVAAASFLVVWNTLAVSPPFSLTHWYAGRAAIALAVPLLLVIYGFYVSLGSQRMLGNVLQEP
jgi:Protein kinase domain